MENSVFVDPSRLAIRVPQAGLWRKLHVKCQNAWPLYAFNFVLLICLRHSFLSKYFSFSRHTKTKCTVSSSITLCISIYRIQVDKCLKYSKPLLCNGCLPWRLLEASWCISPARPELLPSGLSSSHPLGPESETHTNAANNTTLYLSGKF